MLTISPEVETAELREVAAVLGKIHRFEPLTPQEEPAARAGKKYLTDPLKLKQLAREYEHIYGNKSFEKDTKEWRKKIITTVDELRDHIESPSFLSRINPFDLSGPNLVDLSRINLVDTTNEVLEELLSRPLLRIEVEREYKIQTGRNLPDDLTRANKKPPPEYVPKEKPSPRVPSRRIPIEARGRTRSVDDELT